MLEIQPAKAIHGTYDLPSSPDLLFLASLIGCASGHTFTISTVSKSDLTESIKICLKGHVEIEDNNNQWSVKPIENDASVLLTIPQGNWQYRDMILFLGLGMNKTVLFPEISDQRIEKWLQQANRLGICCKTVEIENAKALQYKGFSEKVLDSDVGEEDAGLLLSFLVGARKKYSFNLSSYFLNPLRQIIPAFGFSFEIKAINTTEKSDDPLSRRLRFLKSKKKSDVHQKPSSAISVDFTTPVLKKPAEITLPGDETLAAVLIAAKCLIPKGSFVLSNVPLESWSTQILTFARKAGCKFTIQENRRTSFGVSGLVTLQKHDLNGRKMQCDPIFQFTSSLPAMIVVACFAQAQSVFRGLEDYRLDTPDGIDQLESCIRTLGARHGEMPDGIVLEGAKLIDGFDLNEALPPNISAAMAIAGLRCIGETSVCDDMILRRWPDFSSMLQSIGEFRTKGARSERRQA